MELRFGDWYILKCENVVGHENEWWVGKEGDTCLDPDGNVSVGKLFLFKTKEEAEEAIALRLLKEAA